MQVVPKSRMGDRARSLLHWQSIRDIMNAVTAADALGDWLSGRALRSHRRGHWFESSIAHFPTGKITFLISNTALRFPWSPAFLARERQFNG